MKTHLYWVAFIVAILFGTSAQAQDEVQIQLTGRLPAHVRECMGAMETAKNFFQFRVAGLSRNEGHIATEYSIRVLRYQFSRGLKHFSSLEDIETYTHTIVDEIYDMSAEDFINPKFQQEWVNKTMKVCIAKLAPEQPGEQELRMIPEFRDG